MISDDGMPTVVGKLLSSFDVILVGKNFSILDATLVGILASGPDA